MEKKLSNKERRELLLRHKYDRDPRVRDRIKAILACDDGYSYSEIARILLLDDETIRRHIDEYLSEKKLNAEHKGGSCHMTQDQQNQLISYLSENTFRYAKDICKYIKDTFGIKYSVSGITKWLKQNDFRYKKPNGVPAKANKESQQEFIEKYNELKKSTENKEPIYFVDSVHPQHQTRLAYGWIKKGERKNIAMTGRQHRVNIMGGICLDGHKVVYEQADKINEYSIQNFLYRLRKTHAGKERIHIIWDNAGYHTSKIIKAFAENLGIVLHYLPPYSPNLNPIERLWKIMHEETTYNRYYEKFSDFTEQIRYFFRHIGKKKKLLRSRITDNFQIIDTPKFA